MRVDLTPAGFSVVASERVSFESARPSVAVRIDGAVCTWAPTCFAVDGDRLSAVGGFGGLTLELTARPSAEGDVEVRARLSNRGRLPISVERFVLLDVASVVVGEDPRRWRIYRNGYQSWAGTFSLGTSERDRDFPWRFARVGATDARHRAPDSPGHVRSDALSAICEPSSGDALAAGFLTLADAFGFVEVDAPGGELRRLTCWVDLDGTEIAPNESSPEFVLRIVAVSDTPNPGWTALRRVAVAAGEAMTARAIDRPHPAGWCSWYYYFTRVTERDVLDNLTVLAEDGRNGPVFGCDYVMIDDGHQSAIGDWLLTSPTSFPSGMTALADRIHAAGFDAGIWWAPFLVAEDSVTAAAHPEWLVRNRRGKPIIGQLNPMWGITRRMWVLDTTHPRVLEHLARLADTIGNAWGYQIQKLDFLYAASLEGVRFDRHATRAQSLRRGLEAIRRGAGERSFLLGCGCPLGPAVGVVDAMRIGADVTPYWTNFLARKILLNVHGLGTRHAVMNTLTRAVFDRAWWLNDPDCLMVRDHETKLNEEEVQTLASVFGLTDGMIVLSDRLDRVPQPRRDMIAKARELAGGHVEVFELLEKAVPEVVVSRHPGRTYVGVVNFSDEPRPAVVRLATIGVEAAEGEVREHWSGRQVAVRDGIADFGVIPAHATRVAVVATP